jgi:PAS domain S-box-containing protein
MTQFERRIRGKAELQLIVFGPLLALGAFTALLAMLAGLLGWHPHEMFITAAGVDSMVVLLAIGLVYRQATKRQASDRALQNAEARVSGIIGSAMDAIITVDESQHIVLFNAAAESVFGCPSEQAIGAPLASFIPERFRTEHQHHIRQFGETGTSSRRMGGQRIVTGLRRNGEEFPIDASISQITENGRKFYTVILRDVTERVRAEKALRRSREELRELASAANSLREQEKSRIARELHDELAQSLTALKMDATWVAERLPREQKALTEKLATMQTMLDGTVAATRRISADLRPLMLDDLGLVPAAEWLVQNFTERTGIHCEFAVGVPDLELEDPYASAVFRILQESLTNVARHAQASLVEVALDRRNGAVTLMVRDNGRGFSPTDPRKPNSFGLMGLRERAYLLGGEADVASELGRGTTIEVRIPIQQAAS